MLLLSAHFMGKESVAMPKRSKAQKADSIAVISDKGCRISIRYTIACVAGAATLS